LLVSKRCKREDGTVDLEERAAILASATAKADPGFADALTAQRMIRHLQTGLAGQQGSKLAWGIKRTVVEMLQDGVESKEYSARAVQRLVLLSFSFSLMLLSSSSSGWFLPYNPGVRRSKSKGKSGRTTRLWIRSVLRGRPAPVALARR
jgi:hypothetical protein